ncbi:MAG: MFS transporter [Nesterenkonia sp.]|nr:MFS transporter [Nesterenkonia sp.]
MTGADQTPDQPRIPRDDDGPSLLGVAGPTYFPVALIARFPYAMMVVGVLTIVVSARGSMSLGGLTSAMVGLGTALCGPLIGAAADRFGQRPVLLVAGAASSLTLLTLTLVVYSDLPGWAVLVSGVAVGATAPQVPPLSRSRLVGIISTRLPKHRHVRTVNSTMAYESAADELTFVFGPMIVGLLATTMHPAAPIIGAAVMTVVFLSWFAVHPSWSETPNSTGAGSVVAPAAALFAPRLLVVFAGVLGVGMVFGSVLTSLTSVLGDAGHAERAGLLYGAMGVGSAICALGVALLPERFALRDRWVVFATILLVGSVGLSVVETLPGIIAMLLLQGVGVGPTMVTVFSFAARRTPDGRSATVMTMASTSVVVGQSAAAATTGQIAEAFGSAGAIVIPIGAACVVTAAAVLNRVLTGPGRAGRPTTAQAGAG